MPIYIPYATPTGTKKTWILRNITSHMLYGFNGYPERYYVVPVRYYVVPTFFWVLWVLCIVPMGTVGYYRAAGYYGYCVVPTGTTVVPKMGYYRVLPTYAAEGMRRVRVRVRLRAI